MVVGDGVVGQVRIEVVALLRGGRGLHVGVVTDQVRCPLVGLAVEEPVVAIETLTERPHLERPDIALVPGGQVPLADAEGRVPLLTQDVRCGGGVLRELTAVRGEVRGQVREHPHADAMVVATRQQAGPRRRAHRSGVEVRQPDTPSGEPVEVGGVQIRAVATEVGEAEIVEHDHQDVRGTGIERHRRLVAVRSRHRRWRGRIPRRVAQVTLSCTLPVLPRHDLLRHCARVALRSWRAD